MTPAGTSNELDVQNEWEENTHTHRAGLRGYVQFNKYTSRTVSTCAIFVFCFVLFCLVAVVSRCFSPCDIP